MTFWAVLGALLVRDAINFIFELLEPDEPINIVIRDDEEDEHDH